MLFGIICWLLNQMADFLWNRDLKLDVKIEIRYSAYHQQFVTRRYWGAFSPHMHCSIITLLPPCFIIL